MTVSNEQYAQIAVEVTKSLVTIVDFQALGQVGFDRVVADVFDLTDAFCAELAKRLEQRASQPSSLQRVEIT